MLNVENTSRPISHCQICGSESLAPLLFFGYVTPVNTMQSIGTSAFEQPAFPLELKRCEHCTLVQIGLEVKPEVLFPKDYPYLSGSTKILRTNFANLCEEATTICGLKKEDFVIDIGSNDGTLLFNFKQAGYKVLGVEPTDAGNIANQCGIETLISFFNKETAKKINKQYGKAKLITAANVFAHIADVHTVVDSVLDLLEPEGVFISENHYLVSLVETLQYDTIYHEHLRYYSLLSLQKLFSQHNMAIFHACRIPTHGGSIRVYAARAGQYKETEQFQQLLAEEIEKGFKDGAAFVNFKKNVLRSKTDLVELLGKLKQNNARIFGVGAPSRASTLINYTGLDDGLLECVMEISTSHKLNKYMPGTKIPVLDETLLYQEQPDYALLLSWHIADELIANLKKKGYKGKFIVPLDEVHVVE